MKFNPFANKSNETSLFFCICIPCYKKKRKTEVKGQLTGFQIDM